MLCFYFYSPEQQSDPSLRKLTEKLRQNFTNKTFGTMNVWLQKKDESLPKQSKLNMFIDNVKTVLKDIRVNSFYDRVSEGNDSIGIGNDSSRAHHTEKGDVDGAINTFKDGADGAASISKDGAGTANTLKNSCENIVDNSHQDSSASDEFVTVTEHIHATEHVTDFAPVSTDR